MTFVSQSSRVKQAEATPGLASAYGNGAKQPASSAYVPQYAAPGRKTRGEQQAAAASGRPPLPLHPSRPGGAAFSDDVARYATGRSAGFRSAGGGPPGLTQQQRDPNSLDGFKCACGVALLVFSLQDLTGAWFAQIFPPAEAAVAAILFRMTSSVLRSQAAPQQAKAAPRGQERRSRRSHAPRGRSSASRPVVACSYAAAAFSHSPVILQAAMRSLRSVLSARGRDSFSKHENGRLQGLRTPPASFQSACDGEGAAPGL